MIAAVRARQDAGNSQLVGEVFPEFIRPQVVAALLLQEAVAGRTRKNDEIAIEKADAEDRAHSLVLLGQEGNQIPSGFERAAEDGNSLDDRNRFVGRSLLLLSGVELFDDFFQGAPDRIQARQEPDALLPVCQLHLGENAFEKPAGIRERDDDCVPRAWNVAVEQNSHHSQQNFQFGIAIRGGIPSRPQKPLRNLNVHAFRRLKNAFRQQVVERAPEQRLAVLRDVAQPEFDIAAVLAFGDAGQRRIQQAVSYGSRIDQHQAFEIRVDPIFECQLRQNRARKRQVQLLLRDKSQMASFISQQKKEYLFCEFQLHDVIPQPGGFRARVIPNFPFIRYALLRRL